MMDLSKLKEPFSPDLISWRLGATNAKKNNGVATKGIALAYIDARDVMERLDNVCGVENWQCEHPHANGKTSCRIGIRIDGEWVWKENGAGDSAMDAEKGAFSDSFKRAAVLWGIGRYLYDVANIWVEVEHGKIKNENDPRLAQALINAGKGIRTSKKPTPEQQKAINYIAGVKKEMDEAPTPEDVSHIVHKHIAEISKLTPAQQKHINDYAALQRGNKGG